jgi:hypothetical protein
VGEAVAVGGGHLGLALGHVRHRQQEQLAAEDLLVAGERRTAVAVEVQVRVERHGVLLVEVRLAVPTAPATRTHRSAPYGVHLASAA